MLYSTTKGGSVLKRKKTEVISLRRISAAVKMFSEKIYSDHITLYAAQSSFFTMIATIPFLMLLITLIRIVFPDAIDSVFIELERILPEKFSPLFSTVYTEISSKNTASVLSFSAITMFWSSSRGVAAVTRGVAGVYGTRDHVGFFSELVRSLFYTVAFMALIIATLVVLVFGATVRSIAESSFPAALHIFDLIIRLRMFIFLALLTLFFSLVYSAVSGNGRKNASANDEAPTGYRRQIPGAFIAASGWMLYSYFYSLYIVYFPNASYIYGSLAAVILFMLWVYFCMIIFLVGAEINKIGFVMIKNRKARLSEEEKKKISEESESLRGNEEA